MKRSYNNIKLKQTPQRLAIINFMENNKNHPTVDDIYKAIVTQFPTISVATIYNNLEILKNLGMIKEITIDPQKKHFDPDTTSHNHLICTRCKRIVDININFDIKLPTEYNQDFEITGNHIEFYGICSACKSLENDKD